MRKPALYLVAATLLVAAPAAHASIFSSSSTSSDHVERSSESLTLLEQFSNFLNIISFKVSAEEADDKTVDQGCESKTTAKKSSKKSSGNTTDEDDAKPTGPEPIYFGF